MYTNYDFARALVIDHQQQLQGRAHIEHVGFFARRARRARARKAADQAIATVHHLPAWDERTDGAETRAAS